LAVAFRQFAQYGGGTAASVGGAYPTGTANGEYVLAVLYKENTAAVTLTPASGWTLLRSGNNTTAGGAFNAYLYIRKFTTGDANPSFAWTGSVWCDLQLRTYTGSSATTADGSDGSSVQVNTNVTDTTFVCPTITTAIASDIDVLAVVNFNGGTYTFPSGWINAQGNARDVGCADKAGVSAGVQAAQNVTTTVASSWVGFQVAIKNADAGAAVFQPGRRWPDALRSLLRR
jgi:hypothetical protein